MRAVGCSSSARAQRWARTTPQQGCLGTTLGTPAHVRRAQGAAISTAAVERLVVSPPGLQPEPWLDTPQQLQALKALQSRMAATPVGCPDEATLKWYLRDRYFDPVEAEQKLVSMLRWRRQFSPESLSWEAVAPEAATGKAYVHDHADIYGRPVVVVRVKRHVTGEFPFDSSKRMCVHMLDKALARLPPPSKPAASPLPALAVGGAATAAASGAQRSAAGAVEAASAAAAAAVRPVAAAAPAAVAAPCEQILGVFDLRGFELRNADFQYAAFLVEAFFDYYPRRVSQVLLVDAPWVFHPPWQAIRPLLRKYAALVRFVDRPTLQREFFTPATLPPDLRS